MNTLINFFKQPKFATAEQDFQAKNQYILIVIALSFSIALIVWHLFSNQSGYFWVVVAFIRICVLLILLSILKSGRLKLNAYLFSIFMWLTFSTMMLVGGGLKGVGFSGLFLTVLLTAILINIRAGLVMVGLLLISGKIVLYLENTNRLFPEAINISLNQWLIAQTLLLILALTIINITLTSYKQSLAELVNKTGALETQQSLLLNLQRLYKTQSACKEASTQATSMEALLNMICQIIVEVGEYEVAWVQLEEKGDSEVFYYTELSDFSEQALPLSGAAAGETAVFQTIITLPLNPSSEVSGELGIRSKDAISMNNDERQLLENLAKDIEFGIQSLRTQSELRASQNKFSKAFDLSPLAIAIMKMSDNTFIEVNQKFLELRQNTYDDVIGKTVQEIQIWPEGEEEKIFNALKYEKSVQNLPLKYFRKNKTVGYVNFSATLLNINDELCFLTVSQDITKTRLAQQQIEYQATLFQNVSDAIISTDLEFNIFGWNKGAEQIYGWRSDEVLGRSTTDVLKAEYHHFSRAHAIETIEKTGIWLGQTVQHHKDGSIRQIQTKLSYLFNSEQKPIGFIGINRDITAQITAEEALAQRNKELVSLIEIGNLLTQNLTTKALFEETCKIIVETLATAEASTIWTYDFKTDQFIVEAQYGHDSEEVKGFTAQKDTSIVGKLYRERQPIIIGDTSLDASFESLNRKKLDSVKSLIGVPIFIDGYPAALIFIDNFSQTHAFTPFDLRWMTSLGNQIAILIENTRLFEAADTAQKEMRHLANHLQLALEEERKMMSRLIHDEFGQLLTGINIDLVLLKGKLAPLEINGRIQTQLTHMEQLINDAIALARNISSELRPSILDDLGLAEAIEWQVSQIANQLQISHEVIIHPQPFMPLTEKVSTALFRILKEALTNISRHASATYIKVTLEEINDIIKLKIEDNGQGMSRQEIRGTNNLGLIGIRERTDAIGGNFVINSQIGSGTAVIIQLPYIKPEDIQNETLISSR